MLDASARSRSDADRQGGHVLTPSLHDGLVLRRQIVRRHRLVGRLVRRMKRQRVSDGEAYEVLGALLEASGGLEVEAEMSILLRLTSRRTASRPCRRGCAELSEQA